MPNHDRAGRRCRRVTTRMLSGCACSAAPRWRHWGRCAALRLCQPRSIRCTRKLPSGWRRRCRQPPPTSTPTPSARRATGRCQILLNQYIHFELHCMGIILVQLQRMSECQKADMQGCSNSQIITSEREKRMKAGLQPRLRVLHQSAASKF